MARGAVQPNGREAEPRTYYEAIAIAYRQNSSVSTKKLYLIRSPNILNVTQNTWYIFTQITEGKQPYTLNAKKDKTRVSNLTCTIQNIVSMFVDFLLHFTAI